MRLRLTPQNTEFYDHFTALAHHLLEGATVLRETLSGPAEHWPAALERIKNVEHNGDAATHTIMREVNSSFITPFDRDDIYRLAARMDDCLDHIEASLEIVVLYGVQQLPAGTHELVDTIHRMAVLTVEAMPRLRSMRHLTEYWIEINRLENVADATYRRMIAELFQGQTDAVDIIRLKALVDELEEATDAFETVANTVESIAVKES